MIRYPRYVDRCRNSEESRKLLCFICHDLTIQDKNETWEIHVANPLHRLVLEMFNKSFHQSQNRITCKICSKSIYKSDVIDHAIEHKLAPWYQSSDTFMVFLINFIAQINDQYYCHLCNEQFSFWIFALLHVDNDKHQKYHRAKTNNRTDRGLFTYTINCQLLISHSIFRRNLWQFDCMICDRSFKGQENIDEHIKDSYHGIRKLLFFNKVSEQKIVQNKIIERHKDTLRMKNNERVTSNYSSQKNLNNNNWRANKENISWNTCASKVMIDLRKEKNKPRSITKAYEPYIPELKKDGNCRSRKLNPPLRQFGRVICGLIDSGDDATCQTCKKTVSGLNKFHVHLTSHFWPLFTKNFSEEQQPAGSLNKIPLIDLVSDDESADQLGADFLNTTGVVASEINGLSGQLAGLVVSTKEESKLVDDEVVIVEELNKAIKNLTLENPGLKQSENSTKEKLPTQDDNSEFNYIYEIDEKQLENIQLGTKLSLVNDNENHDFYCMICREKLGDSPVGDIYEHFSSIKHNRYLKQMQSDDLICQTFSNTLSDLQLAREFIVDISDSIVECRACDKSIDNVIDILEEHIESKIHKNNCVIHSANSEKLFESLKARMFRNWYHVQYYKCIICDLSLPDELCFIEHLSTLVHEENRLHYISKFEELIFDFCTTCATLWFGFQCAFSYHSQCPMHKHLQNGHYYLTELPKEARELLTVPEKLAEIDYNVYDDKLNEEHLMNDLKEITMEVFPNATIHPFGSRVSGLASKKSDMDVYIDCNGVYHQNDSSRTIGQFLKAIEKSLRNYPKIWEIKRIVIKNVRVPIIKTEHKPTGIECDISFSHQFAVENTALIKSYIDEYPLCRKLIMFMKIWIEQCNLNGYREFSSYTVTWMVIFYLQCKNILPSVNELIGLKKQSRLIGEWQDEVKEKSKVQSSNQDFMQLLKELFIFYSQFNYKYEVICPLLSKTIRKDKFISLELPSEMDPYIRCVEQKKSEKFYISSTMCLQDPLNFSGNFTKNVSKFAVHQLKTFCLFSAQLLENNSS